MESRKEVKLQSIKTKGLDKDFFRINEMVNHSDTSTLTVDIVIPTYRPDQKFNSLMKRLRTQTVQPQRVFIINTIPKESFHEQGKAEQEEFMQKYRELNHATIIHISQDEFDHGATRAYGASLSNADLIMFMTQDAIPADDHLIEELMKPFHDPQIGAAYARQLAASNADEIETFTRIYNYPATSHIQQKSDIEKRGIKTFFCSDVCAVYRKEYYEELGGFVKKAIFNEDMLFAYKLIDHNYKVAYVAEAKVFHSHHYTYRQQFVRNFDLGVSHAENEEIFRSIKSESEGIRLVKKTAHYLMKRHRYFKLVDLFFTSGFKYMGYFFGVRYKKLPRKLVLKWSMNKNYWK